MMNANATEASIQQEFVWRLLNVLILSGCPQEPPDLQLHIASRFKERFDRIIGLVAELKRAMYEDLISMDLHPFLVMDGAFKSDTMSDAYPLPRARSVGTVAGTTELGLWGRETRKTDAGTWAFGDYKVLLKPTVVLSDLFALEAKNSETAPLPVDRSMHKE